MLLRMRSQFQPDSVLQNGPLGSIESVMPTGTGARFMGYVVKPADVAVPVGDPFQNDCLDRGQTAEALSRLVRKIDGPCVVCLDAEWGMGKTTFLRMWQEQLSHKGFPVVMFNAWDNDFANEPFLALSEELRRVLGVPGGEKADRVKKLASAAKSVLVNVGPALSGVAASLAAGGAAGDIAAAVTGHVAALAEQDLSRYAAAGGAMKEFRKALEEAAAARAAAKGAIPPLVVLIDELDRCRPSYAVEVLEVLKHLFAVKGVVFVLAVHRSQLEHAVKALYGAEFDATVYLRRFFDVDLRLPDVNRNEFIDAQVKAIWHQLHTISGIKADGWRQHQTALDWARRFFGGTELDLRTVQQALHRLGLVLAMSDDDPGESLLTAMFVLILRTRDQVLYQRFVNEDVSDLELADLVFGWVDPIFRSSKEGAFLEAAIILAAMEHPRGFANGVDQDRSELYGQHTRRMSEITSPTRTQDEQRARLFLRYVDDATNRLRGGAYPSFRDAVRRLELVAGDDREVTA